MLKKERVNFIINTLEELFPEVPVPLDHKDAFTLLIAVLLSAQTTDAKVNEVTPDLFALADNPKAMQLLSEAQIRQCIKSIGLAPTKARAIKKLSELLLERHDGQVPANFEALEALPGVGHKTASVVMAQAFGEPAFPVDTHIHRLMYRWGLSNGKSVVQTEKDAKRLFPKNLWNKLHLQIIYYGRQYSPARGWNLEQDIITKTVGRKSVIDEYYATKKG